MGVVCWFWVCFIVGIVVVVGFVVVGIVVVGIVVVGFVVGFMGGFLIWNMMEFNVKLFWKFNDYIFFTWMF